MGEEKSGSESLHLIYPYSPFLGYGAGSGACCPVVDRQFMTNPPEQSPRPYTQTSTTAFMVQCISMYMGRMDHRDLHYLLKTLHGRMTE